MKAEGAAYRIQAGQPGRFSIHTTQITILNAFSR